MTEPSTTFAHNALPAGKLASCDHVDPREIKLNKLRQVASDMKGEAEAAKQRLARAEQYYAQFIKSAEAPYKNDPETLGWFRTMLSEEKVDLKELLEQEKADFKVEEAMYIAEKESIRRQIRVYDKQLAELKKRKQKKERGNAIQTLAAMVERRV